MPLNNSSTLTNGGNVTITGSLNASSYGTFTNDGASSLALRVDSINSTTDNDFRFAKGGTDYSAIQTNGSTDEFEFYVKPSVGDWQRMFYMKRDGSYSAFDGTNAVVLPKGTTAQRPASPVTGMIRFNTTLDKTEYYSSTGWIPVAPFGDGSSVTNASTSVLQFDSLSKSAGTYYFAPPGANSATYQLYYTPNFRGTGYGFVRVFSSPTQGTATLNLIDVNLPITQLMVNYDASTWATAGWSDGTYRRFNTRGNAAGNSDLTTTGTKIGYKVFFGYAGGHGIYNSSQETCNWGNSTGAIGAGYDGSCGTFPNDLRWGTGNATAYYNIIQGTWEIWIRW